MVMHQQSTVRKTTWTAGWSLKKRLDDREAEKKISERVPAAKKGLKMYPSQEMAAVKGTQEQRCAALDTWCSFGDILYCLSRLLDA